METTYKADTIEMGSKDVFKKQHKFQGRTGIIGIIFVLLLGGYRSQSLSSVSDPSLEAELKMRLGPGSSVELGSFDSSDLRESTYFGPKVNIHSMKLSAPLLSVSNKEEVVVKVEYSLEDGPKKIEYIRYLRYLGGSWKYKHKTTVFGFYSNLIS